MNRKFEHEGVKYSIINNEASAETWESKPRKYTLCKLTSDNIGRAEWRQVAKFRTIREAHEFVKNREEY